MQSIKNFYKLYFHVIQQSISNHILLFPVPVDLHYFRLLVGVFPKIFRFCFFSRLMLIKKLFFKFFSSLFTREFVPNSTPMLKTKKTLKTIKPTMMFFCVIWKTDPNKNWEILCEKVVEYFALFSLSQWISSLVSLIFLYWITGRYYNRLLANKGGWLDVKTRIWLIVIDLVNNFAIGIYCMYYRDTLLGQLMVLCPIAISPAIFVLELLCVHLYKSYINRTGLFKK